jgi:hypothetical protein
VRNMLIPPPHVPVQVTPDSVITAPKPTTVMDNIMAAYVRNPS